MVPQHRHAEVVWEGSLIKGNGKLAVGSHAFKDIPVTWAARTEKPDGVTSPEELLAAAHATCFSMAMSNILAESGHPPQRLRVSAVCTLDRADGGFKITTMDLDVRGQAPGVDEDGFRRAAEQAKEGCPVSGALWGNVDIRLQAHVEVLY